MQNNSDMNLKQEVIKALVGHLIAAGFTLAGLIIVAAFSVYIKMQSIESQNIINNGKLTESSTNINNLNKQVTELQKDIELLKQVMRFMNRNGEMKGMIKNDTPPDNMKFYQNQDDKPSQAVIYDAEVKSPQIKTSNTECTGKECEQPPVPAPTPPDPKPPTPTNN